MDDDVAFDDRVSGSEHGRGDVDHVGEVASDLAARLDARRPVDDRAVARAAPVRGDLLGPLVGRVHRVRPADRVVVVGLRPAELVQTPRQTEGPFYPVSLPLDAEELLAKLKVYLGAKLSSDRAYATGLIDPASGLYDVPGILMRVRELGLAARRHARALGCATVAYGESGLLAERKDRAEVSPVPGTTRKGRRSPALATICAKWP